MSTFSICWHQYEWFTVIVANCAIAFFFFFPIYRTFNPRLWLNYLHIKIHSHITWTIMTCLLWYTLRLFQGPVYTVPPFVCCRTILVYLPLVIISPTLLWYSAPIYRWNTKALARMNPSSLLCLCFSKRYANSSLQKHMRRYCLSLKCTVGFLSNLSFLGRLPPSLFCIFFFLLFVILVYFGFKASHPLRIGQKERPKKLNKFSWDCEDGFVSALLLFFDLNFAGTLLFQARAVVQVAFFLPVPLWIMMHSSPAFIHLERGWHQQLFEREPCLLSLPQSRSAMQSDPSPFCLCKVDPTLSHWWNEALQDGITPCFSFVVAS